MKKIGVVIPVYNGENSIEKSIVSLLKQTFDNWIAIIINDGSTDSTKSILEEYKDDDRFCIIHFAINKGRPFARQKGLEIVKGLNLEYMCMLDADDWYYPEKLSTQYSLMENNKNLTLLSSGIIITNKFGDAEVVQLLDINSIDDLIYFKCNSFSEYIPVPHASSILRVSDLDDSKYDKRLSLGQDQDFMLNTLIGREYAMLNKPLYVYNLGDSMSFKKYYKGQLSNLIVLSKYVKKSSLNYLSKYAVVYLKISVAAILFLFNKSRYLISLRGKKPNKVELDNFNNHHQVLSESL